MKVTAKQWVKYHESWYQSGEIFEVKETDLDGMAGSVELIAEPQSAGPAEAEQPKPKRARKKKADE